MKTKKKFNFGPLQKKWLALLETGKLKQVRDQLCHIDEMTNEKSYCCLGVAADLVLHRKISCKDGVGAADGDELGLQKYKSLGLYSEFGEIRGLRESDFPRMSGDLDDIPSLSNLNDGGVSFKRIANFIRKYPEAVFSRSV